MTKQSLFLRVVLLSAAITLMGLASGLLAGVGICVAVTLLARHLYLYGSLVATASGLGLYCIANALRRLGAQL